MVVLICLMTSAITARNARKYEKKVYLPEPTGGKTPMCCKIALDSDLPFPRSAFLTFPFEAYLDSPGRTQHDQR